MTKADAIREHVLRCHIQPARAARTTLVVILRGKFTPK
jgi:hypothetical protein